MKMTNKGFTLIEMMIAISVMSVIVMGGTMIFYKTLTSSGLNQAQVNITSASYQVLQAIESSIRYQQIDTVSANDRSACIAQSSLSKPVSGITLGVHDQYGTTVYSRTLANPQKISSNSAVISSPNLIISRVQFDWYCVPGSYDKLRVTIDTNDSGLAVNPLNVKTFSKDINMYNGN